MAVAKEAPMFHPVRDAVTHAVTNFRGRAERTAGRAVHKVADAVERVRPHHGIKDMVLADFTGISPQDHVDQTWKTKEEGRAAYAERRAAFSDSKARWFERNERRQAGGRISPEEPCIAEYDQI